MDGTGRYVLPFGAKAVIERKEQHMLSCLSCRVVACGVKVTSGRYPLHILQKVAVLPDEDKKEATAAPTESKKEEEGGELAGLHQKEADEDAEICQILTACEYPLVASATNADEFLAKSNGLARPSDA